MHITQRQVTLGLQILLLIGLVLITISQIATGTLPVELLINLAGILTVGALITAYLRGWAYAPKVLVVMGTVLAPLTPPPPLFELNSVLTLLIPPATALLLAGPEWIVGSAAVSFAIAALRPGEQALPDHPAFYIIYVLVVAWMVLARLVMDTALRDVQASAHNAEQSRDDARRQAEMLAAVNRDQEKLIGDQQRLIDLVATLEAPASPLADGVLFVPIVGAVDSRRVEALTGRILQEVSAQRARLVILDIAGASAIDAAVARGLMDTVQALRLLGCDVTLSGISSQVALTLVELDISLKGVTTVHSPQEALARFFDADRRSDAAPHSSEHQRI